MGDIDKKENTKIRKLKEENSFVKTFFDVDFTDAIMYGIKKELIPKFRHSLWEAICVVSKRILVPEEDEDDFDSYFGDVPSYKMDGGGRDYTSSYKKKKKTIKISRIRMDSREEAKDIIEQLRSQIREYGSTEVNEYLEMCGFDGKKKYEGYGWKKLDSVGIRTASNGEYYIALPDPYKL